MSPETCEYCEQEFEGSTAYDRHLRNHHDDELDDDERDRVYGAELTGLSRRQTLAVGGIAALGLGIGAFTMVEDTNTKATNEYGYDTLQTSGVAVPLAPVDDVYEWYDDPEVVFVDARSATGYEQARIEGAVHSPAPDGKETNDPVTGLDPETRIVTYCGCPHHLSTLRAASLIDAGYTNTYAIDEGFFAWQERGYPVTGTSADQAPRLYRIDGRTSPEYAGQFVWARHRPTGQREPARIGPDGSFRINVQFYEVSRTSELLVSAPTTTITGSLGALSERTIEL